MTSLAWTCVSIWTTNAYRSKHCTGRYQDTRQDQVNQERTSRVQSTKTYERWGSGCVTVCHAWTTANSHRPQLL